MYEVIGFQDAYRSTLETPNDRFNVKVNFSNSSTPQCSVNATPPDWKFFYISNQPSNLPLHISRNPAFTQKTNPNQKISSTLQLSVETQPLTMKFINIPLLQALLFGVVGVGLVSSEPTDSPTDSPTENPTISPTTNSSGLCDVNHECELGTNFCNYDDGTSGYCESCSGFTAPEDCDGDGLPSAGAQDCKDQCDFEDETTSTSTSTTTSNSTPTPTSTTSTDETTEISTTSSTTNSWTDAPTPSPVRRF